MNGYEIDLVESTIAITYSNIAGGWSGTGNINVDPLFVGNGDYHLTAYSPCINVGTSAGAPSDDIDGDIRPWNLVFDMGADEYVGMVTPTNAAAYWSLDEGSGQVAGDEIGGNDGVVNGASWIMGKYGTALSFDGVDDYILIADNESLRPTNISIEAWIYHEGSSTYDIILAKRNSDNLDYQLHIINSDNKVRFHWSNPFGILRTRTSTSGILSNQWTHVVATLSDNVVEIYINGVPGSVGDDASVPIMSTAELRIGHDVTGGNYFSGLIDEVVIYNYALTQCEVNRRYLGINDYTDVDSDGYYGEKLVLSAGGAGVWKFSEESGSTANDKTGNNNHGIINGATWSSGDYGSVLSFDGIDDYVDIGKPIPSALRRPATAVSIEAWVYPVAYSNNAENAVGGIVASQWDSDSAGYSLSIDYRTSAHGGVQGGVHFQVGDGAGFWTTDSQGTTTQALPLNQWTHVVAVAEANNAYKVYFNGELVADWTAGSAIAYSDNCRLAIGWNEYTSGSTRYFNGLIDEAAIYNRALSQDEIKALYLVTGKSCQDCDDTDAAVNLGMVEVAYNGKDDDCNAATLDDDLDEDTYPIASDCDDTDPAVNPGVAEVPYNGKDDDCNAATLDDDLDEDTYPIASDCDDTDASVNPGIAEVPYNGKDDDCNAATPDDDLDEDTYPIATDCDDTDASVNPGANEICDDVDNNCDGQIDEGCTGTIYVPGDYSTIQAGIDAAVDGDMVLVDDGIYTENIDFNGKAITVKSENGAATTTIDGNASGSVVTFENSEGVDSVLDGFTITNGSGNDNSAYWGGGIYCNGSSPVITNCSITGNTASGGGDGGGIACWSSSPTITNCTIHGNIAEGEGGGIKCSSSSSPTMTNCTISGNSAANYDGGGIKCANSLLTIANCTISGNLAASGGGIACWNSSPVVVNSILWGNTASTDNEIYLNGESSIIITYSDIQGGWSGIGNIEDNPLFSTDYHLSASSPCINSGTDDTGTYPDLPSNDIDGDFRPQGTGYDMGADEYVGPPLDHNISLTIGWNLISLFLQPTDSAIESVLSSISGKYASVWAFMNGNWKVYDPANPEFSDLLEMEAGWGYWIKMNEAATLSVSGTTPSDTIDLVSGWNLVGYNSTNSQALADALASIEGKYVSVWAFIDGGWKVYDPANPDFSDLLTMEPNYGYWINTTQACTWTLP